MNQLWTLLEKLTPEALELITIRYQLLRQVWHKQPMGRRQLCKELGYTERQVRNQVENLKTRGLLSINNAGIYLTDIGEEVLNEIDEVVPSLFHTQTLAKKIKNEFSLHQVYVVPGDSYLDPLIHKDLGRAAARLVAKMLLPGYILAVTGGTTLAEVANSFGGNFSADNILIVPARGGLGEDLEQQAGTIAAKMAKAIRAEYSLLHIPDHLEVDTANVLKQDIHVREIVNKIKNCNILLHGIGSAMEMVDRRGLSPDDRDYIYRQKAVGEVLRYYFDKKGNIVYEVPGIGLEVQDLRNIPEVVAVAGGSNKGQAIRAVLKNRFETILITDEGAANEIIKK